MLSINNLYKSFGGIQAINNVSLNIEKSTVTALIGPNGAGKTTLFNIINGSIKPDSGSIKLENIELLNVNLLDKYSIDEQKKWAMITAQIKNVNDPGYDKKDIIPGIIISTHIVRYLL